MNFLQSGYFYTEGEARRLLGRRFRIVYPFFGVPAGTFGRVIDLAPVNPVLGRGFELIIEWEFDQTQQARSSNGRPDRSFFNRTEMERFMECTDDTRA